MPRDIMDPQPRDRASEAKHAVGPVRPAEDGYDPSSQLSAARALEGDWSTFMDLAPDSEAVFLHGVDGRSSLSFQRLREFLTSDAANVLGHSRSQRLCTAMPNGPEAAVCFLAFSLRCAFAPLSLGLSPEEFDFEFLDLPATTLVVQSEETLSEDHRKQSLGAISAAQKAGVHRLVSLTPSLEVAGLFELSPHTKQPPGSPLHEEPVNIVSTTREDLALVLHTSGTTRKPKIVPLTHANIACGAQCIASTVQLQSEDVSLNAMPLFHIHGLIVNVLASFVAGAQLTCLSGNFQAPGFCKALESDPQPTWYSAVPSMHEQVLQHFQSSFSRGEPQGRRNLGLVRNCSAALLPSVAEAMEETLAVRIMPTYAMTESMPIASNPRLGPRKLRSVGPGAGPEMAIMSAFPCSSLLRAGEEGEVVVRGGPVTAGYEHREHMDADPNEEAFSDGWLRTGDKGWLDCDGYLYLSGRFKEIINRAGEKISPFEIEDALRRHSAISDCIAFAAPHASLGETVGFAVVLKPEQRLTLRELRTWVLREQLLQSKWLPDAYVIVPSIPKGPTGKPARIGLAERLGMEPITGMPREWQHASW